MLKLKIYTMIELLGGSLLSPVFGEQELRLVISNISGHTLGHFFAVVPVACLGTSHWLFHFLKFLASC
jgi:hypothetical protein